VNLRKDHYRSFTRTVRTIPPSSRIFLFVVLASCRIAGRGAPCFGSPTGLWSRLCMESWSRGLPLLEPGCALCAPLCWSPP